MTSPKRRPLKRADLDVEDTLRRALKQAPEIELGWSVLKDEMRNAGWPSRTPEDDRKPRVNPPDETPCIDYTDPTGDLAGRLEHLADDLDALQDHWHLVATSLRAMATIAAKYRPPGVPAVPACSVTQCDQAVESHVTNGGLSYRGMEQIAGYWVAKPGTNPTCAKHRKQRERAA